MGIEKKNEKNYWELRSFVNLLPVSFIRVLTGHCDSRWWCSWPASRKQLRDGRKRSQVFSITDEFRSLGCSVEEWWGLWSPERTCLQNVQHVMVSKQEWLSVSGQHGAVQRRARRCHVRKQPWSRPVECLSVLRKMLQNMEKFTSWSVEKRWDPVAFWEVWQEQCKGCGEGLCL